MIKKEFEPKEESLQKAARDMYKVLVMLSDHFEHDPTKPVYILPDIKNATDLILNSLFGGTVIKHFCDHCGKEIPDHKNLHLHTARVKGFDFSIKVRVLESGPGDFEMELCLDCIMNVLQKWGERQL